MRTLFLTVLLVLPSVVRAEKAPDLKIAQVLQAPVGKIAGLAELKGRVVFVEFWATWCGPCVAGIPRTNRLIESLKGEPVVFLSVTDEPAAQIQEYLKTTEMKAWVGIDQAQSAFKAYKVHGRPDGYLIGKDGTLLARIFPDSLKESDIRDVLAGRFKARPVEWPENPSLGKTAQTSEGETFFEIRISSSHGKLGMSWGAEKLEGKAMPFAMMMAWVWDMQEQQVILDTAPVAELNFSLKTPKGGFEHGRDLLKSAVQSTFGIKAVPESREMDVYVLVLSTQPGAPHPKASASSGKSGLMAMGGGRLLGNASMAEIAKGLWMGSGKPVIDETGLAGDYHVDLEWDMKSETARDQALASLGLLLAPARRSVQFLRVMSDK